MGIRKQEEDTKEGLEREQKLSVLKFLSRPLIFPYPAQKDRRYSPHGAAHRANPAVNIVGSCEGRCSCGTEDNFAHMNGAQVVYASDVNQRVVSETILMQIDAQARLSLLVW